MAYRTENGFSLIEVLVGVVILGLILIGTVSISKNSSVSNRLNRDLSDYASRLNDFVDSVRSRPPDSLPANAEQLRITATDTVRWRVYNSAASAPYTQPAGLFLLNAKMSWRNSGRTHAIETSTLLSRL